MRAISRKPTARPKQVTRKKCSIQSKIVSHSIRQDGSGWCEARRNTSDILFRRGRQPEAFLKNNRTSTWNFCYAAGNLMRSFPRRGGLASRASLKGAFLARLRPHSTPLLRAGLQLKLCPDSLSGATPRRELWPELDFGAGAPAMREGLLCHQPGNAQCGLLLVPIGRDMFEGEPEFASLMRSQGRQPQIHGFRIWPVPAQYF